MVAEAKGDKEINVKPFVVDRRSIIVSALLLRLSLPSIVSIDDEH